jgi:hypothetical protein
MLYILLSLNKTNEVPEQTRTIVEQVYMSSEQQIWC